MSFVLLCKNIGKELTLRTARACGLIQCSGHHFIGSLLDQHSTVLDLGANKGEFSGLIARKWNCRIIGIEADPATFNGLPQNGRVRFFNRAISSSDEPVTLYLSNNPEGNSINLNVANGKMGWRRETVIVRGATIRSLVSELELNHIDLLKMDIEGAEIDALAATPDEQLCLADQIAIEFHDCFDPAYVSETTSAKARLRSLGYLCLQLSAPFNLDVLFIHKRVLRRIGLLRTCGLLLLSEILLPLKRAWGGHLEKKRATAAR